MTQAANLAASGANMNSTGKLNVAGINATGTPSSTTYLRGDGAWSTVSGGVTSAVAGNGIAVSGATGAVTFSVAAPTAGSVGSYVSAYSTPTGSGNSNATYNSNYAAGSSQYQIQAGTVYYMASCFTGSALASTNSLSGTWKWLGATYSGNFTYGLIALAVRVA